MNKRYTVISLVIKEVFLFSYKLTFLSYTKHFHKSIFVFLKKCFNKKINSKFKLIMSSFPPKRVKLSPDKFSPRQDKKGAFLSGRSLKSGGGPLAIKDRPVFKGPSGSLLSAINTELFHFRE